MDSDRDWSENDNENNESIVRYEDMIRKNTSYFFDVDEFQDIIDYYIDKNRPNSALRAIEIASGMHPLSSEIQLRKAQVLANTGRKSEALSILKKLEKVSSENPDVFLLMGIIYIAMDKEKEALENFEKSIHLADETKEDILISTAISLENAEKFTLAIKYLNQALKIQTTNTGVIFELAYCYERLANYTESIKYYQMFLDEDPFSSHVWFNLGVVYNLTDAFEEAIEAFGYAIAIDDSCDKREITVK